MNKPYLLEICDLSVQVDQKPVLNQFNLNIKAGEVHAIMGPNGSGKSTLANVLARNPNYTVTSGDIRLEGQSILSLSPDECARQGLFLSFQYPIAIPGVSNVQFLKASVNAHRKAKGEPPLDAVDFLATVKKAMVSLDMSQDLLYRAVNDGFSGGEKKRNEILQMSLVNPKVAILDETDSGLDIDALKSVASGINTLRNENNAIILITHYQRLLDYVVPDHVHVVQRGNIVHSGDKTLPQTLEEKGYAWLKETE